MYRCIDGSGIETSEEEGRCSSYSSGEFASVIRHSQQESRVILNSFLPFLISYCTTPHSSHPIRSLLLALYSIPYSPVHFPYNQAPSTSITNTNKTLNNNKKITHVTTPDRPASRDNKLTIACFTHLFRRSFYKHSTTRPAFIPDNTLVAYPVQDGIVRD